MSQPQARSSFVTVVAWIFIVMSGMSTLISILQNVMINTMFPSQVLDDPSLRSAQPALPFIASFMFEHVRLIFALVLTVSATTLACSIGLLRRSNAARLGFIGLMGLGIAWNVFGLYLQYSMFASFPLTMPEPNAEMAQFETFRNVILAISAVFALAVSSLFAWIGAKLLSAKIAAEFQAP